MNERIAYYQMHKTAGESYQTYVPVRLLITIDVDCLQNDLDTTNIALGKLSECAQCVPDLSLLYQRRLSTFVNVFKISTT